MALIKSLQQECRIHSQVLMVSRFSAIVTIDEYKQNLQRKCLHRIICAFYFDPKGTSSIANKFSVGSKEDWKHYFIS